MVLCVHSTLVNGMILGCCFFVNLLCFECESKLNFKCFACILLWFPILDSKNLSRSYAHTQTRESNTMLPLLVSHAHLSWMCVQYIHIEMWNVKYFKLKNFSSNVPLMFHFVCEKHHKHDALLFLWMLCNCISIRYKLIVKQFHMPFRGWAEHFTKNSNWNL